MRYIEFKECLKEFTIFSLTDIQRIDKNFQRRRLSEWQAKGYIKKIMRGFYIFSDLKLDEHALFEIANRIYRPSYVSFEMALSYYHLIPESVYAITSASTRRTCRFTTPIGTFSYRTIKPELLFGYDLRRDAQRCFKIATIEKAVLDYFYINPGIEGREGYEGLRMNREVFATEVNEETLHSLLARFSQKRLTRRVNAFLEFMKHA